MYACVARLSTCIEVLSTRVQCTCTVILFNGRKYYIRGDCVILCSLNGAVHCTYNTGGHKSPDTTMVTSNLRIPRPGSTTPACTGTCHATKCRACYYSQEVHACPRSCSYSCGEDPGPRCFKKWSQCVKNGLRKMVSPHHSPYVCMLCTPQLIHSLLHS